MLRILHLIRHLTVTPSPQGEGFTLSFLNLHQAIFERTIPLCVILSGAQRSRTRSAMRSIGIYNELYCVPFEIPLRALPMVGFDYENITP